MLVLVDDDACVCVVIALEQLCHAVLDGVDTVLVVFDDHHELRGVTAGECCICDKHNWWSVNYNHVVFLLQVADKFSVVLGTEQFGRVARNVAARHDEEIFNFGGMDDVC